MRSLHADLTLLELGYFAGIIDGEGSICVVKDSTRGVGKETYSLRLSIVNTSKEMIDWIAERFGGNYDEYSIRGRWKQIYAVRWVGKKALETIEIIAPYLVTKKPQAECAITFMKFSSYVLGKDGVDKDIQASLYKAMKGLNL